MALISEEIFFALQIRITKSVSIKGCELLTEVHYCLHRYETKLCTSVIRSKVREEAYSVALEQLTMSFLPAAPAQVNN